MQRPKPPTFSEPYPHYIEVIKRDGGLFDVKTNTNYVSGVHIDRLTELCMPYAGISTEIELRCDDPDISKAIVAEMERLTFFYKYLDDEHPVLQNAFENYAHVVNNLDRYKSFRSLENAARGKSIVFLGAGPSLSSNIEFARQLVEKNQAIVIAGGSACRVLSKHKIYPHYALCIDPNITEKTHVFDHISQEFFDRVPFITTCGMQVDCFKQLKKAYVACPTSMPDICSLLEPEEEIIPEGLVGVSTMAPYVAEYMGCKKLFMLGVDLIYGASGKRYEDEQDGYRSGDDTKFDGFDTRHAWLREAQDIIKTCSMLGIQLKTFDRTSLLNHFGVEDCMWADILNKPYEYPKDIDKALDKDRMYAIFSSLLDSANETLDNLRYKDADFQKTPFFKCCLFTYHKIQQFREVRTGDYNHCLLKHVIRNCLRWIEKGITALDNTKIL